MVGKNSGDIVRCFAIGKVHGSGVCIDCRGGGLSEIKSGEISLETELEEIVSQEPQFLEISLHKKKELLKRA